MAASLPATRGRVVLRGDDPRVVPADYSSTSPVTQRDRAAADPDRAVGVAGRRGPSRARPRARALARRRTAPARGPSAAATRRATRSGFRSRGPRPSRRPWGRTLAPRRPPATPSGYGPTTPTSRSTGPGPEREHRVGAAEQHRHPAGPVVDPLGVEDLAAVEAEHVGDVLHERALHRPAAHERRPGEREARRRPADRDQAGPALLAHDVAAPASPPASQPGMAGPERRVPGERELERPA